MQTQATATNSRTFIDSFQVQEGQASIAKSGQPEGIFATVSSK